MSTPPGNLIEAPNTPIATPVGTIAINSAGQFMINGVADRRTSRVDVIGYNNGLIWQKNADNLWWYTTGANQPWTFYTGAGVPPGLNVSPAQTGIFDTADNNWQITANFQIEGDGVVDPSTRAVMQLFAPASGGIWQENTSDLWYFKRTPASPWSAGTFVNPLTGLAPSIWKGGGNNDVNNPQNWINGALTPGKPVLMNGGETNIGAGGLGGNLLTIQPITAAVPKLDMAGGTANVTFATQSQYLKTAPGTATGDVINNSQNLNVRVTGPTTSTLNLPDVQIGVLTVTADANSIFMLTGGFAAGAAPMQFIQHGGTFAFNSSLAPGYYPGGPPPFGNTMLIDGNLAGNSPITFTGNAAGSGGGNGNIEVTGTIAASSGIYSYANGLGQSGVILDDPKGDLGSITILNGAWLELKNMATATSYSFVNDMLTVVGANGKPIAAVKLTSESFAASGVYPDPLSQAVLRPEPISVGKDSAGNVFAYATNWAGTLATDHHLTALPHT